MIRLNNITKIYNESKDNQLIALNDINLTFEQGESVAIIGKSGSGKSTLLHLLAGIDKSSKGYVEVNGQNLNNMNDINLSKYRNEKIGIIMQEFCLIKDLNVLDNVRIPLTFQKGANKEKLVKATKLVKGVGLGHYIDKNIKNLSGGEKQRVAIARALATDPSILLADEPTGSLDIETGNEIMDMLLRLNKKGKTLIIVTHDIDIANRCKRIITLKNGSIIQDISSNDL